MAINMNDNKPMKKLHCNKCTTITSHKTLCNYRNGEGEEEQYTGDEDNPYFVNWHDDWYMLECQGCENIVLEKSYYLSDLDGDDDISYYPPLNTEVRQKPIWYPQFRSILHAPHDYSDRPEPFILQAYDAIYSSVNTEQTIPAMLTLRALLEHLSIEHGINGEGVKTGKDKGSFKKNITALKNAGYITDRQAETLENTIYDAGSATMHRSYNPSKQSVESVLDILEKLIHTIYIEPKTVEQIETEKPERQ